ncbi:MAG: alanine--glyoxylate aminotransferase family protein [Euryarchaeota archaeon]|nr:alanine--glyoxylate aminotransferase family protein [Euryarchaeota archaeon]
MGELSKLLIPGPVPIDPQVMEELVKPAAPHYGEEWVRRYRETLDMLRRLFQMKASDVYPLAGPGHAGMDAIAFTLLRRGDRVVTIDNGFFGARISEVMRAHHLKVDAVSSNWGEPPDVEDVERAMRRGARCLVVVHNETSTGMKNPVRELAKVAWDHGAWTFVDAVSSLGGLPLPCDAWGIEACFAASQKCIAAPPGIAPIAISKRLMDEADPKTAQGWYLNLFTWNRLREEWAEWHPQPTTISTNVFYAFHRALQVLHEEGLEARIRRHEIIGRAYREGLRGLGFTMFSKEEYSSNTVSSARPPKGLDAKELIARLNGDHGIVIAGTLGPMRGQGIRIGHLGTQATPEYVELMLTALAGYARSVGVMGTQDAIDRAMQIAAKAR